MYRVKEINVAYDLIPSGPPIWVPNRDGVLEETASTVPGPGWIYCSNEIETLEQAQEYARKYTARTGLKTEIDNLQKLLT